MVYSRFESLGAYLPETTVSSEELMSRMKNPLDADFEKVTGIRERRVRSHAGDSFTFAVNAALDCLSRSGYKPGDIDAVINTSISRTMDYPKLRDEPSLAFYIKNAIGAEGAVHFDISNACAGMITGAMVLDRMIRAGKVKNGPAVSGESISAIIDTARIEVAGLAAPQLASLTVGDSGAAFILDRSISGEGIDLIDMVTVAGYADLCLGLPSDKNPGMAMYTRSKEIHDESISRWPGCIEHMFRRQGRDFDPQEYDYLITHQTSVKAIKSFINAGEKYFGRSMPAEFYTVADYGNTASTSHFVLLYTMLRDGGIRPGSKAMFVSNASGLVIGCLSANLGELEV